MTADPDFTELRTDRLVIRRFRVEDVDAFVAKAEAAGAKLNGTDDYGFMYQGQFDDPDGNHFAPFWTDPDGPPAG